MITEDYCSPGLAQALQEKAKELFEYYHLADDEKTGLYKTVTHQRVMKWLREEKGFHIVSNISYDISIDTDGNEVDRRIFWFFEILSSYSGNVIYIEEMTEYDSYEESVEAALKYCLENLI